MNETAGMFEKWSKRTNLQGKMGPDIQAISHNGKKNALHTKEDAGTWVDHLFLLVKTPNFLSFR